MTPTIDDAFIGDSVPPKFMDALWAAGWRHFGRYFFRYSTQPAPDSGMQTITPLRIDLTSCVYTKSQRRVLLKNADLRWEITPARLDDDLRALFQRHKQRFTHNIPDALENFLGEDPSSGPLRMPHGACLGRGSARRRQLLRCGPGGSLQRLWPL